MAYAQWATFTLSPKNYTLTIKNVVLKWGKFYKGSKDNEVKLEDIEGVQIKPGDSYKIETCGREDSPSGTEGSFDIYDGNTHVASYYWDCPWGSKSNTSTLTPESDDYLSQQNGANLDSGALGNITIKSGKFS